MFHYVQIEKMEDGYGYIVADSYLSGEVISDDMILIIDPIDYFNHRWNYETMQWEEYTPEPKPIPEPQPIQPTNQDIMDKLNLIQNQKEQDIIDNYTLELIAEGIL